MSILVELFIWTWLFKNLSENNAVLTLKTTEATPTPTKNRFYPWHELYQQKKWLTKSEMFMLNKAAFLLALEHVYGKQHEACFYTWNKLKQHC